MYSEPSSTSSNNYSPPLPESEEDIESAPFVEDEAPNSATDTKQRISKLPIARVKYIMKMDPDCQIVSQDAVIIVAKATELFLETLASQVVKFTIMNKRKTVLKRDLDATIESNSNLCFLDGTLD